MKRPPKILITNQFCQLNMGDAMILNATIQLLREILGEVDVTVLSYNPATDAARCTARVLEAMGNSWRSLPRTVWLLLQSLLWAILWRNLHLSSRWLVNDKLLRQYLNADAIIVRGGDTLTKYYGFLSLASHLASIIPGVLMRRPVILLGHSIGPFGILASLAKAVLNGANLIVLREELSQEYLQLLGIVNPRVHVTADLSVQMGDPDTRTMRRIRHDEVINNNAKWIGVSVSQTVPRFLEHPRGFTQKRQRYVELMATMIDYVIERFDTHVLLIPTTLGPKDKDDRIISRAVCSKTTHPERIKLVANEYKPEELVGIIGCCEIFIGARMHACMAALMKCVPTIALSYGHKYLGIIGRMWGQGEHILNVADLNWEILKMSIDEIWDSREEVRRNLHMRREHICMTAEQTRTILRGFFKSLGISVYSV